ncbi:MAG: hypothetical protein PWR01_297 [Clostridiales bacterium]|nr:hypothetical protein [Clostridiales bacterium]
MILVDTSVMIAFLKGIKNKQTEKLVMIIKNDLPFGINDFIYQEVLQGARTKKEFNLLKEYLGSQRFFNLKYGRKSYEMAAELYFRCIKHGITIRSTIDLLIAQTAIENDLYLLHDDRDFLLMASIEPKLKEY